MHLLQRDAIPKRVSTSLQEFNALSSLHVIVMLEVFLKVATLIQKCKDLKKLHVITTNTNAFYVHSGKANNPIDWSEDNIEKFHGWKTLIIYELGHTAFIKYLLCKYTKFETVEINTIGVTNENQICICSIGTVSALNELALYQLKFRYVKIGEYW
jgi:hypothetical protein